MSKIVKKVEDRDLGHIVQTSDGNKHYVDSADTFDAGYETMAFLFDEHGKVLIWREEYCEHYLTYEQMKQRHMEICENLEEYLA